MWTTAVGYAGGSTPNPTYEEVCSGQTGHTEAVLVVFDPKVTSYEALLKVFWESHDPTQGMRQGNDVGTQYRSAIYTYSPEQRAPPKPRASAFQAGLAAAGYGAITTEIRDAPEFYFAEDYHQQYLAKNPFGYCGLGGTGVSCPADRRHRGPAPDRDLRRRRRLPGARGGVPGRRPARAGGVRRQQLLAPDPAARPAERADGHGRRGGRRGRRLDRRACRGARCLRHRRHPAGGALSRQGRAGRRARTARSGPKPISATRWPGASCRAICASSGWRRAARRR